MAATQVSSPWGKKTTITPCSLTDVINDQLSEELAVKLQKGDVVEGDIQVSTEK